jgi:CHAT domain-containing protein/tetratricopeptide (TPR) repeat protein
MEKLGVLFFVLVFLSSFIPTGYTQAPSDTASLISSYRYADSLLETGEITKGKHILTEILIDLKRNQLWEGYFSSVNILSQLETDYGNLEAAFQLNDEGQAVIKQHQLEDTEFDYSLSVWRINTLIKNNEYQKALDLLKSLMTICRSKKTSVDTISLHNQFSLVYSRQGKYTLALDHALQTITHDSLLTAVNCFNLASFYDVLNDRDKRDEYLLKAHKLAQKKEGIRGVFEQINVLLYMANLAKDESNLGLASEYADQAENLFENLPPENQKLYSGLYTILLRVQITIAIKLHEDQVVRERMKIIKNYTTPNACFTFNELANYFGGKRNIPAQDTFLKLSKLCVEANNNNPVLLEFYEDTRINRLFRMEKYAECTELAMKSLGLKNLSEVSAELTEKGLDKVRYLNTLHKLSVYLFNQYIKSDDRLYLDAAFVTSQIVDSLAENNIKDVTSKLSRYKYDEYFMVSHHVYAARYHESKQVDDLNKAIEKFERIRTYQQAKIYTSMLLKENVALKQVYKIEQQIIEDLNELEKSIRSTPDSMKLVMIDEINETKERLIGIRKRIKDEFPAYFNSRHQTEFPTLDMIQAQMTKDQKVVTYSKKWNQLVIMEFSQDDHQIQFVELPLMFNAQLDSFMSEIKGRQNFDAFNTWMSSLFIDPLDLEGYSDITFITDPVIPAMPFELLIPDFINPPKRHRPKTIRYAYSLTSWLHKFEQNKNNHLVALTSSYQSGTKMDQMDQFNVSRDSMLPIPNTEKEVSAIASLFRNNEIVHNPSKTEIKKSLQGAGIIHFATHTVINNENPNFSKLVFESPSGKAEENDVFLYEIPGLDLQAQLVCLSSCNSGVGKYISGEGISGLGQTFAYAGCTNTVQSLWPVDDASTSVIMRLFYSNLKEGQSKSMALSNAKRQFVREAPDVWRHPYFWAGFVYYGDDQPLYSTSAFGGYGLLLIGLIVSGLAWIFYKRNLT